MAGGKHFNDVPVDQVMSDPLFRCGYFEIFDGRESSIHLRWSEAERLAYGRGRQFGTLVLNLEDGRLPLMRGGMLNPRARGLLQMAFKTGEVA